VIELGAGTNIWVAAGVTNMRPGFHGLMSRRGAIAYPESPLRFVGSLYRPLLAIVAQTSPESIRMLRRRRRSVYLEGRGTE
jgi:hypothetical protein